MPEHALVVLSHLRWDFVWQRPQHLMTRAARSRTVWFVETPFFEEGIDPSIRTRRVDGVLVCQPLIPSGHSPRASQRMTAEALLDLARREELGPHDLWVYTPMELPVADLLSPRLVVYDCMDELANFRGAPVELARREQALFARADIVFTGGHALWESKRRQHHRVRAFPSSVDVTHFARARRRPPAPPEVAGLPAGPLLGYCGVIDERLDYGLLDAVARRNPDWQFAMVGPVVKVSPEELPRRPNVHFLGARDYSELPEHMAQWDVALMPFALNEATEFISPTKTPEYLAAGLPVVSTPVRDVVRPWGVDGLVAIAGDADAFARACEQAMSAQGTEDERDRRHRVDAALAEMSWERTWAGMSAEMAALTSVPRRKPAPSMSSSRSVRHPAPTRLR